MAKKITFPTNFSVEELAELRHLKKQQDAEEYARKRTEFQEVFSNWLRSIVPFDPLIASSVFIETAVDFFFMSNIKEKDIRCLIDNDIENAKKCKEIFKLQHGYGKDKD